MKVSKMQGIFIIFVLVFSLSTTSLFAGGAQEDSKKAAEEKSSETKTSQEAEPAGDTESQESAESQSNAQGTKISVGDGTSVATVNGVSIKMEDFQQLLGFMQYQYSQQGMQIQGQQLEQLKRAVLESLIDDELVYQIAMDEGYAPTEQEIEDELQRTKQQFGDEEAYKTALKQQGIDESQLKQEIKKKIVRDKYTEENFYSQVELTEQDVKDFYENNPDQFTQPFQFRSSHILVQLAEGASEEDRQAAREKIEAARQRIESGEEFSEVAREVSEGPSAKNGGDLNYAPKGSFVPAFEEAALGLEVGEISDIVETRFGYHIIKLTDVKEEQVAPFEEVKDQIAQYLERVQAQEMRNQFLTEKKEDADIVRSLNQAQS